MRASVALTLALVGCAGWGNLPTQSDTNINDRLWDPSGAVARVDGVYLPLPHAGGLVRLDAGNKNTPYVLIDIGEGRVTSVSPAPDGETLVAFVERYRCTELDDRDKEVVNVEDCLGGNALEIRTELSIVRDGKVQGGLDVDGAYNRVTYAEDGRFGIAWFEIDGDDGPINSVINLTSVVALDLVEETTTPISVGFATDRILFVEGADGAASQAVVLSQNSVALIDLQSDPPRKDVTFPLTLDPDQVVDPIGVDLTPDGRYALITVDGSADLYALDLVNRSINIVELAGKPSDMRVNDLQDRTVLVYGRTAAVDVLDHTFFDVETFDLDEPMDHIEATDAFAVLWADDGHDVYRLDLTDDSLVEYRLQNPAVDMFIAPGERFAVALTRPENGFGDGAEGLYDRNPGMEILDLEGDDSQPFLLEGMGLGIAFADVGDALYALLLQEGVDYLYQLDLYTGQAEEVKLAEPPVAIGAMADGTFFITHDLPLGLVSFWDPSTGKVVEVGGFASVSIADLIEVETSGGQR
ncbi:MAG: hypothetical protein ACI8PZ_004623 [Myxococcota bacterium]|jgi:hypothetical protein